ncbi:hypothetical protein [Ruminiclostridium papyrosolvens]|uniref:Uncharacterized protein n=1 Tax=Ruminiclostridium papyrosolvens C7 TaxID=1330534 RepID=U4R0V0_9FIRM|nr:hypothetical protein [Ruminiclostridium papyrosolvens]EPR11636.1 hypothetical protein L323_11560 [Ruminiclostridium papyrosolvens C7]
MEELKTIIELLKKIRAKNNVVFNSCQDEKLMQDIEYGNLYQEYWTADFRLKNVIGLLEAVEKELINDKRTDKK